MRPGPPALCNGAVVHRRCHPEHQFTYPSSLVWLDPDRPDVLCDLHPAWSARRPAPVHFRRRDYGADPVGSLVEAAIDDLTPVLGYRPSGPVRLLTQLRRWGWLFNPISFFFVWDALEEPGTTGHPHPVGVVLEVTNTPWKERVRYPLALTARGDTLEAKFDKALHVSPFLEMNHRYALSISNRDDRITVDLDVLDADARLVLHTALRLRRAVATRANLGRSLWSQPLSTHRVSVGIHAQAVRLWVKRVPFVAHPRRRSSASPPAPSSGDGSS